MSEQSKYLIQHLLRNGSISYNDADDLLERCAGNFELQFYFNVTCVNIIFISTEKLQERHRDIKLTINELNQRISLQSFHIDIRTCEISGEKQCVIVNTRVDNISKTATGNTPAEVELFDAIIKAIMTSDAKWISAITCMNLTSKLKNSLSKDAAQECLDKWSQNGYLVKEDGLLYLGARTISEFESYFRKEYPIRMTTCKLCTSSVYYVSITCIHLMLTISFNLYIQGKICANCYEVTHKHCIKVFWKKDKKCPSCKKSWKEAEGRIYEEDVEENNDESMDTED